MKTREFEGIKVEYDEENIKVYHNGKLVFNLQGKSSVSIEELADNTVDIYELGYDDSLHVKEDESKIKVNIETIWKVEEWRHKINVRELNELEFFKDGKKLNFDEKAFEEWRFIGLNPLDFITTGHYKNAIKKKGESNG